MYFNNFMLCELPSIVMFITLLSGCSASRSNFYL